MKTTSPVQRRRRTSRGFTLVELVIVVLIIGILAAVAVPKLFDTSNDARANGTRASLQVIRNSIEIYRSQNGGLPGDLGTEADLKADLNPYIQGGFPRAEVGNAGDTVRIATAGTALTVSGTQSWAYDNVSGEFIVNHASYSAW